MKEEKIQSLYQSYEEINFLKSKISNIEDKNVELEKKIEKQEKEKQYIKKSATEVL